MKIMHRAAKFTLNRIPAGTVNFTYDLYSRIYKGQLIFGLPVSEKLLETQEEIRNKAIGKLALSLSHALFRITRIDMPRSEIKAIIAEELDRGNLMITENVISIHKNVLRRIARTRFGINNPRRIDRLIEEARSRRILKESLRRKYRPAYFESEIEEEEETGRGSYETVFYTDYTPEGKEITFRRLANMDRVMAKDARPTVLLMPGIGANSACFNVNNRYSVAKDLADEGIWTYLFDPRGMGVNKGKFDPHYTVDTLIDYDLPAVARFIYFRSKGKPLIVDGHSMGGMVTLFSLINWSMAARLKTVDGLTREQREILKAALPVPQVAQKNLRMIRGVITRGSPMSFERNGHLIFPYCLWLNHISRIARLRYVPATEGIWFITKVPFIKRMTKEILNTNVGGLNFLVSPHNHDEDPNFIVEFIKTIGESFPLGLGFQFLKAIYNGEGFKRMDGSKFNYPKYLHLMPPDIPIFHIWGAEDPLAPPTNAEFSRHYPHKVKRIYFLRGPQDVEKIEISKERSQVLDFVIEGANHYDLIYGKAAREVVHPLVLRIIKSAWGGWTYQEAQP